MQRMIGATFVTPVAGFTDYQNSMGPAYDAWVECTPMFDVEHNKRRIRPGSKARELQNRAFGFRSLMSDEQERATTEAWAGCPSRTSPAGE
jgi:hypothetical protein